MAILIKRWWCEQATEKSMNTVDSAVFVGDDCCRGRTAWRSSFPRHAKVRSWRVPAWPSA